MDIQQLIKTAIENAGVNMGGLLTADLPKGQWHSHAEPISNDGALLLNYIAKVLNGPHYDVRFTKQTHSLRELLTYICTFSFKGYTLNLDIKKKKECRLSALDLFLDNHLIEESEKILEQVKSCYSITTTQIQIAQVYSSNGENIKNYLQSILYILRLLPQEELDAYPFLSGEWKFTVDGEGIITSVTNIPQPQAEEGSEPLPA